MRDSSLKPRALVNRKPASEAVTDCDGMLAQGLDLLRDLLAIEPAVVLNAAFCERHLTRCPQHEHLKACEKVRPHTTSI